MPVYGWNIWIRLNFEFFGNSDLLPGLLYFSKLKEGVRAVALTIFRKSFRKFCNSSLSDTVLNMKIVCGHARICVTDNTLDCLKINTESLHLTDIGVSAAILLWKSQAISLKVSIICLHRYLRKVKLQPILLDCVLSFFHTDREETLYI